MQKSLFSSPKLYKINGFYQNSAKGWLMVGTDKLQ